MKPEGLTHALEWTVVRSAADKALCPDHLKEMLETATIQFSKTRIALGRARDL
jgi:hypothetical protein